MVAKMSPMFLHRIATLDLSSSDFAAGGRQRAASLGPWIPFLSEASDTSFEAPILDKLLPMSMDFSVIYVPGP
jgi:hypothetical protein